MYKECDAGSHSFCVFILFLVDYFLAVAYVNTLCGVVHAAAVEVVPLVTAILLRCNIVDAGEIHFNNIGKVLPIFCR